MLDDDQLRELASLLLQGASTHGWPNDLWTIKRIRKVIQKQFHFTCHPKTVWRIVKKYLRWTVQRPIQQLRVADYDEINRWLEEDYPRIVARV